MKEITENIWLGQAVLTLMLAALSFFLTRYIRTNDRRMELIEKENEEIKKNYTKKFQEVHDKIDERVDELKDHFTREIKEVVADSHRSERQHNRELGEVSTKIDYIIRNINNKP